MKVNPKFLIMMAALVGGSALAVPAATVVRTDNATNAGTIIKNTAEATYTDPTTNAPLATPVKSNEVITTVSAKQGFNITYTDGTDLATTGTVAGANPSTDYTKAGVLPGTWVAFQYVAVNNGNDKTTITLDSEVTGLAAADIKYYDGSATVDPVTGVVTGTELPKSGGSYQIQNLMPSGDDPSTTPAVETNSGLKTFTMVYQVPTTTAATTAVGASPKGTAQVWDSATKTNVSATEQKTATGVTYDDLFWQYNSVTTITPILTVTPKPTIPVAPVVTPPTGTNYPADPTNPVSPPNTTGDGTDPTTSGYIDTTNPATSIAVSGDNQTAYPVADIDATADSVTFTNTVTNGTSKDDTVTVTIVPNVVGGGAVQTITKVSATVYTISQLNTDGTTTTATVTLSTATPTAPANGSVNYTVTVTYPDADNGDAHSIVVKIGVDSGNDSDTTPNAFSTDTVVPASVQFGDATLTATGDPVSTFSNPTPQQIKLPGETASFPMDVTNTGEYGDTYYLSGYVVIPLADGTKKLVPVAYTGTDVKDSGTTRSVPFDVDGDGTIAAGEAVTIPVYITKTVAPNTEIKVSADVVLPANAGFSAGYSAADLPVQQQIKANYGQGTATDTNDTIRINLAGTGVNVAKFRYVAGTVVATETKNTIANPADYTAADTAQYPNGEVKYKIIAKNNYNIAIIKFVLSDTVPTNTTFVSVLGSTNATGKTVIYSTDNGATWTATAPTTGTTFLVALDATTGGDLLPDALPAAATVIMDFVVTVK
ncbi:hypothetical protein [Deinococcus sp. AJ005]|uniref:hypothetical protein n=1 Tax=Deinococcus sp. AJ005 TaxID=2652443 RepID=UPI00125CB226|nr:hypothetical protein [Deinococcus sp. AJ005]QFP75467.1 hypothetical protein DAAJ005_02570 [Deinococcus sp. AJ005]